MSEAVCKNCHRRIITVNGPPPRGYWTHQEAGKSFMDGTHQHCHLKIADPKETR